MQVHLALVAGHVVPSRFYHGLHRSFASWLNRPHRRLGPVLAERPKTTFMPLPRAPVLVAYIHNNPVRAGLVGAARETDGSSHRMWIGADRPAPWLDVERGLHLSGDSSASDDRRAFDELVCARALDPRDAELSRGGFVAARRAVRAALALPIELCSPMHTPERTAYHVRYLGPPATEPRWSGTLDALVERVSAFAGVPVEAIRSRSRVREIVRARRLVCVVAVMGLRRPTHEVAAELGVADPAVTAHVRRLDAATIEAARTLEASVRGGAGPTAA